MPHTIDSPLAFVCGACGASEELELIECATCGASFDDGTPVARVVLRTTVDGLSISVKPEIVFEGEWDVSRKWQTATAIHARLKEREARRESAPSAPRPPELPTPVHLARVSHELRAAYARAIDESASESERRDAIELLRTRGSFRRELDATTDEERTESGSTRVVLMDALKMSDAISRAPFEREMARFKASAESIWTTRSLAELPPLLRAHREIQFSARREHDLTMIADGIESVWPRLREHLAANPGVKSTDADKALELASGWLATFTHFIAGTGALRRETVKNRVRLWYVGEEVVEEELRAAWAWLAELR